MMDPSQQASPAVPEEAQLILAVLLVVLGVGRLDPLGPCREKARMDQVDGESFDRDLEDTILGVVDHQMAFHIQEGKLPGPPGKPPCGPKRCWPGKGGY